MSSEEDGRESESRPMASLLEEFWEAKKRALNAETLKDRLAYGKWAFGKGLSLTDYDRHKEFRNEMKAEMDGLDWDESSARNWQDAGPQYRFQDWEEIASEKHLNNVYALLAEVESFLVKEKIIPAQRKSPEELEEELEVEILRRELVKLQGTPEEDDGRED